MILYEDCIAEFDRGDAGQRFFIGYSGGVDSHVLLHHCASILQLKGRLQAVYIHHGLQADAELWAVHCEKTAKNLGVEFLTLQVNAKAMPGESPEEAARNARYAAFKTLINVNDVLLLAQHQEDQLETVLLQLFRGSGLRGLSGMPEQAAFGRGVMLRPLLNTPKQAISDYAKTQQLSWVEDPSNQSNAYDRNFLRNAVLPQLKQRWPAIDKTVARSAKHCAEAQRLVEDVADELFTTVFNPADKTLSISLLVSHRLQLQPLIIRHWFQHLGLKMPAQAVVGRILTQVIGADGQRDPVLSGQGYTIRRYRDKLYCLPQSTSETPQDCVWPSGQTAVTIAGNQLLSCLPSSAGILLEHWQNAKVEIKFRRGGELISLPGRQGRHSLKNLFQEAAIPPWERGLIPLIYMDDVLAAVGDIWIGAAFYTEKTQGCIKLLVQH
ncbi:MAG: tRNA lysidine(34) synthetase TilS [Methylobacter sp.]